MPRLKRVTIETVSACNLRCIHCAVSQPDYRGAVLKKEHFDSILPLLRRYKPEINLSGHGETLMHKDFKEMFLKVLDARCPVGFQTNGILLDEALIDFLVPYGGPNRFRNITISLDAAEPILFEKIRRGAQWDRVLKNIETLQNRKKEAKKIKPSVGIEFVAMLQNIAQLPDLVKLSKKLEVDWLIVSDLTEYPLVARQNLRHDLEKAIPILLQSVAIAKKIRLDLHLLPGIKGLIEGSVEEAASDRSKNLRKGFSEIKYCTDPWEFIYLKATGEVLPCCWMSKSIEGAQAKNIATLWKGKGYQKLREELASENPPFECQKCYARPSIMVPKVVLGRSHLAYAYLKSRQMFDTFRERWRKRKEPR